MNALFRDILLEMKNIRRLLEKLCESKQSSGVVLGLESKAVQFLGYIKDEKLTLRDMEEAAIGEYASQRRDEITEYVRAVSNSLMESYCQEKTSTEDILEIYCFCFFSMMKEYIDKHSVPAEHISDILRVFAQAFRIVRAPQRLYQAQWKVFAKALKVARNYYLQSV